MRTIPQRPNPSPPPPSEAFLLRSRSLRWGGSSSSSSLRQKQLEGRGRKTLQGVLDALPVVVAGEGEEKSRKRELFDEFNGQSFRPSPPSPSSAHTQTTTTSSPLFPSPLLLLRLRLSLPHASPSPPLPRLLPWRLSFYFLASASAPFPWSSEVRPSLAALCVYLARGRRKGGPACFSEISISAGWRAGSRSCMDREGGGSHKKVWHAKSREKGRKEKRRKTAGPSLII